MILSPAATALAEPTATAQQGATFRNNVANFGGAIAASYKSAVNVDAGTFEGNRGDGAGAAICPNVNTSADIRSATFAKATPAQPAGLSDTGDPTSFSAALALAALGVVAAGMGLAARRPRG